MKLKHLKKRSVINVYNGYLLGSITDIIIGLPDGKIDTLIIRTNFIKRIFNSSIKAKKTYVSWQNIVSIGKDVILVNIIDK